MQAGSRTGSSSGPPRSSRMALASILVMLAVSILAMPRLSIGAEVQRGQDIRIDQGESLDDDAYLLGADVDFDGRAARDVFIAAGTADVSGTIDGSLSVAAGEAKVSGDVGSSLRVLGGSVEVTGAIAGDLIVAGGRVTLPSQARISGDVILAGGYVNIQGDVAGDVTGYASTLIIAGTVNGSVDVSVNEFTARSTANINGDLKYHSPREGDVSSGADIGGTISRPGTNPWDSLLERGGFFGPLLRALWLLLAGAALILIAPRVVSALTAHAGRPLKSAGVGILAIWLIPIVAIVLVATVIGLPVGMLMLALFVLALYMSQIAVGLAIGRFILPNRWHDGSRGFYLLAMTLGVLIVFGLKTIPVPWVAGIVGLIVTIWGFGAAVLLIGNVARTRYSESVQA